MEKKHLFDEIKHKSVELGFDDFGITDLKNFEFNSFKIKEFINNNYHGEMNWLKEKIEIRSDPKNIWEDAKSAIVLGINYGPEIKGISEIKGDELYGDKEALNDYFRFQYIPAPKTIYKNIYKLVR